MLSQPTTTTTKSPSDRPIRRVSSWDRKQQVIPEDGGFGFEYVLDGNRDPEYDGGFGNQLVRTLTPFKIGLVICLAFGQRRFLLSVITVCHILVGVGLRKNLLITYQVKSTQP